jgi:hypothetical protein
MSADETFLKFLNDTQEKYGFTHEQTREILKKHQYASFKASMLNTYQAVVRAEYDNTEDGKAKLAEVKAKKEAAVTAPYRFPDPIPCPVCGANTYGSSRNYGRWTKKPGWECSKDKRHFGWVKCNEILQAKGMNPLPWEKYDNITSPTYSTLPSVESA